MELLAQAEVHGSAGRWIVTPRKGMRFVGTAERKRTRARERRRKVLVFLLESIGITGLIGLVPPLRVTWTLTAIFGALLFLYVWLLLSMKRRSTVAHPHDRVRAARPLVHAPRQIATRYVAGGPGSWARATFNGLGSLDEGDSVHVVVRSAGDLARA